MTTDLKSQLSFRETKILHSVSAKIEKWWHTGIPKRMLFDCKSMTRTWRNWMCLAATFSFLSCNGNRFRLSLGDRVKYNSRIYIFKQTSSVFASHVESVEIFLRLSQAYRKICPSLVDAAKEIKYIDILSSKKVYLFSRVSFSRSFFLSFFSTGNFPNVFNSKVL